MILFHSVQLNIIFKAGMLFLFLTIFENLIGEKYEVLVVLVGRSGYTIVMLTKKIVYGWSRPRSWGGELNLKSHLSFLLSQNALIRGMRTFVAHKF